MQEKLEKYHFLKMGNKEGKFKKVFEEIDASGDGSVSLDELEKFLGAKYLVFSPFVPSK